MIVAVPADFAVITPDEEMVATEVLLEDHLTDLSVAFEGVTVAVSLWVSPTVIESDVLLKLTPVTATVAAETVTEHVAVLCPSNVVTVMIAFPDALAVMKPVSDTVATDVLLEDQITAFSVALEGETVAVKD